MAKFAVRARAVDMLGRQQIAGIPTAIHELFKNAYDAYATRIEVDYVRESEVVIVRDNGIGMTREDFESRWLALGTESKHSHTRGAVPVWTGPDNLPERPVLGEKGIGRLAIATIAPIVLVLTRAVRRDGVPRPITCGLVCWDLFEVPGIDITAIEIPVEDCDIVPDAVLVNRLRDCILANAEAIMPADWPERTAVLDRLRGLEIDPAAFEDWLAADPDNVAPSLSLADGRHGTHFYLFPALPDLDADLREGDDTPSNIRKILLGFGNTLAPDSSPPIATVFRDHHPTGVVDQILSGEEFFSPQDFTDSDHLIEGRFDERGTFQGNICIYGQPPKPYIVTWPDGRGRRIECGPFAVRVAALQGTKSESRSPRHEDIFAKMYMYGGFYVYLDGIRVLPYGHPDFDWLNIERRRSMKAGSAYFSHRRMIGYVALNRPASAGLIEKAGREGFRQNQAYRDLHDVLENWLKRIAQDYFRENAEHGEEFREIRASLLREANLLKRRAESVRGRRASFAQTLDQMHVAIEARRPEQALRDQMEQFSQALAALVGRDADVIRQQTLQLEQVTRNKLISLLESHRLSRSRGFALTKAQERAFNGYLAWFNDFESGLWRQALDRVGADISALRQQADVSVDRQQRTAASLIATRTEAEKVVRNLREQAKKTLDELDHDVKALLRQRQDDFRNAMEEVLARLSSTNLDTLPEPEVQSCQRELEDSITGSLSEHKRLLEDLSEQFASLRSDLKSRTTTVETVSLLERRVASLEDELSAWRDLAQAGSAVGILGHETAQMAGGIRNALNALKLWADATPGLRLVYDDLRNNFDHIDGLLGLFTPLGRRLRRQKRLVTGQQLRRYLEDAFGDRLRKEEISLTISESFDAFQVETFLSTLLAALVNIFDNAIYWILSEPSEERKIWLDERPDGLVIGNNGPGIDHAIAEHVFDFGVSTKPDGRGMGLTVSRDALRSAGMDLQLLTRGRDSHPEFLIVTSEIGNDNAEEGADNNGDGDERGN